MGYEYARFSSSDNRQTILFELTHGLINNLDFEVEVPTIFVEDAGNHQAGLGDLTMKSKVRFLKGREANPLSIAGQIVIKFPTCKRDKLSLRKLNPACTGEVDLGLKGIASKAFDPVTVHLNVGYIFVGNPPGEVLDDIFQYSLAFQVLTPVEGLALAAEVAGEINRNIRVSGQNPLAFLYGVVYEAVPHLKLDLALSSGFTEASPDYSVTTGLGYLF